MARKKADDTLQDQKINGYNIMVLVAVGMSSINMGYSGNVIGITLGKRQVLLDLPDDLSLIVTQGSLRSSSTSA